MNGASRQFLAGAALAGDQHRFIGSGEPADHLRRLPHRGTLTDDVRRRIGRRCWCRLRRRGVVFLKGRVQADEQPLVLDRPLHQKLRKSLDRQARKFVQRHPQHA